MIRFYQKDLDQAECDFRRALAFGLNGTLESLFMLSELLRMKGDFAQSMRLLQARYRLEPDVASLGFALAYDYLAAGEWQQGWPLYENRLKLRQTIFPLGLFPNWQGESLHGKRVLVLSEQGLGDAVMASSQLHKLAAIAADWKVMGFPQLQPLMAQTFGAEHCVSEMDQSEIDSFDVQVGLCSLPYVFGFSGAPDAPEPFLSIRPEDVSAWKARLAKHGKKKVIGFTWFGGGNALNKQRRSMELHDLLPLFCSDPNVLWVSMQYGGEDTDAELIEFASRHQLQLPSFRELSFEPYQQAALLLALDLTISVQQTLVHLAGSVGANLWAILPTAPEWRYGNSGSHMPWYSSVSLYRQTRPFDWEAVIDSVARDLGTYLLDS